MFSKNKGPKTNEIKKKRASGKIRWRDFLGEKGFTREKTRDGGERRRSRKHGDRKK